MTEAPHHEDDGTPETAALNARSRRLMQVLRDLGVLHIVGNDWAEVQADGALFTSITPVQLDRLMIHLEDLRDRAEPILFQPVQGQYTLDLDPVVGPTSVKLEPAGHLIRSVQCG